MSLWYPRHGRRAIKVLACLGALLFLLHSFELLNFSARRYDTWAWAACPGLSPFDPSCKVSRAVIAKDVLVVIKTGGSEPQSRLKAQLATMLSEVPKENVLLFSDIEEDVDGPYHVHDVYADLTERERASYPEFALYEAQQEVLRQGRDIREVQSGWLQGGWELAKYMNLAMKRRIWSMSRETREKSWFIFLDTDTFVDWDNLLGLLEHHDFTQQVYIGSPVWLPRMPFAHGGSAYVLSHGAMKALNNPAVSHDPEGPLYSQYGLNTTALCCGDEALARALRPRGVPLKGYWPMFNGEIPATLSFGSDLWCEPVISLHHLGGDDMQDLWEWVERWKAGHTHPLLFESLFQYVAPQIKDHIEDWDNIQDDLKIYPSKKAAHRSFEHCHAACTSDHRCFQFVYDGDHCAISHHIRLGRKRSPEGNGPRKYTSGWITERIKTWTEKNKCTSAHWVRSNP